MTTRDLTPITSRVHRGHCWIKTDDGPRRLDEPLDNGKIQLHLAGKRAYGACPIAPGSSTTRLALFDLDSHKGDTAWPEMLSIAESISAEGKLCGLRAIAFRSSGGAGIHMFFCWNSQQDSYSVRQLLRKVLSAVLLASGTAGVASGEVEIFPKQDAVPSDGFGSMFVLPYSGKSEHLFGEWTDSDPIPILPKPERPQFTGEIHGFEKIQAALAAIPNDDAGSLSYDDWRNIIFAIHHASDGNAEGLALAHQFSARSPKYDPAFLDERVWPYVRSDRDAAITARTIFHHARVHGYVEDVSDDFEVIADDETPSGQSERFRVIPAHEFVMRPAPEYIIDDVLPQAELVVMYGASGSGKSFMATDIAAAIATGTTWREHHTTQGSVVYCAAEGAGGFRNRLLAIAHQRQIPLEQLQIGVIPDAPNLLKLEDTTQLIAGIKNFGKPSLIVIDTLAQVTPGGNENSGEDMGKVIGHCKRIHKATGAVIMLIHHSGKDEARGARGWSGLRGACDAEFEIIASGDDRVMTITKMKDGEDGIEYGFKLLAGVQVGANRRGEQITSCVVEHGAAVARKGRAKAKPKGVLESAILIAIDEELGDDNKASTGDVMRNAVERLPYDASSSDRDTRSQRVKRALETMITAGLITISDGLLARVQG